MLYLCQGASVVVFAEYSWIPGNLRQAEDRAHRIGQTTSVNVYYLHVRSSVDDIMWAKIQSKLENVGQARSQSRDSGTGSKQVLSPLQVLPVHPCAVHS